jgi:amino acid permease
MGKKELSLFEASSVVAGLGVGGGIMAVPYLASLNGLIPVFLIMIIAYTLSLLLHLTITEMVMRDRNDNQLVEIFGKYLFRGKAGAFFTWTFFIIVTVNFYTLLAAFIIGIGDLLVNLLGIPLWISEFIGYAFASGPIFFGLKALGISEKYAISGIIALVLVLTAGSLQKPFNPVYFFNWSTNAALALYGMLMFAFACFFSIPQAARGLRHKERLIPWSVAIGLGINFILIFLITVMAVLISENVTELAIIGWGNAVGQWAVILGSVFVLLAILTSYWSTSYALAVIIEERLKWDYRVSWLIATLPTLVLALSGLTGFLGFMRIAGGLLAVMISIMIIPAFRGARKYGTVKNPSFTMGFFGNNVFQIIIILAYIVVIIGSMVPVK